jgi:hypothetical protein
VWRDNVCETVIKMNDDDEWSSDWVILWLERRQNRDVFEWWGEWPKLIWHFYSSGGWSRAVRGEWLTVMVQIQCFDFGLTGETTERSVAGRWSGDSDFILAIWEESVTQCIRVATSVGGGATPGGEREETTSVG